MKDIGILWTVLYHLSFLKSIPCRERRDRDLMVYHDLLDFLLGIIISPRIGI